MAEEWTKIHRRALVQLEEKIDNARYQLECQGRKNTIININGTESHVITLALAKYKGWLEEKEKEESVSCETSKIC